MRCVVCRRPSGRSETCSSECDEFKAMVDAAIVEAEGLGLVTRDKHGVVTLTEAGRRAHRSPKTEQ